MCEARMEASLSGEIRETAERACVESWVWVVAVALE